MDDFDYLPLDTHAFLRAISGLPLGEAAPRAFLDQENIL